MKNFKKELLAILKKNNLTLDDIEWVGTLKYQIEKEVFFNNINFLYDNGYGAANIALDLIIVGKNFWLERYEYDGYEEWRFKKMPVKPNKIKNYTIYSINQYNGEHYRKKTGPEYLNELNWNLEANTDELDKSGRKNKDEKRSIR